MLAAVPGGGCLVSATTPAGQRGWFYEWFEHGGDTYSRWKVPYTQVKRITKEYAAQYRASVSRQVWAAELSPKCCALSKNQAAACGIQTLLTPCSARTFLSKLRNFQQRRGRPDHRSGRIVIRNTLSSGSLTACE